MFKWAIDLFGGIFSGASGWIYGSAIGIVLSGCGYIYYLQGEVDERDALLITAEEKKTRLEEQRDKAVAVNREQNATIEQLKSNHRATITAMTAKHDKDLRTLRQANQILQRSLDAANTEKDGPVADITVDVLYDIDRMLREE